MDREFLQKSSLGKHINWNMLPQQINIQIYSFKNVSFLILLYVPCGLAQSSAYWKHLVTQAEESDTILLAADHCSKGKIDFLRDLNQKEVRLISLPLITLCPELISWPTHPKDSQGVGRPMHLSQTAQDHHEGISDKEKLSVKVTFEPSPEGNERVRTGYRTFLAKRRIRKLKSILLTQKGVKTSSK